MRKMIVVVGIAALMGGAHVASAQETAGAGRWEAGFFPGGGTFFTKGSSDAESSFDNYALGASFAWNANRLIAVEGEIGGGLGIKQDITFNQTTFTSVKGPSTVAYNGNVVYSPAGSNRAVVPYVTGGMGGLTLRARTELQDLLGVKSSQSFFSQNFGGGVKWYSTKHWGLRGDYRFIVIDSKTDADPFFGLNETRYGNRIYGSLMLTY